MKISRKKILFLILIVFVIIQFFPVDYNISYEDTPNDFGNVLGAPKEIQDIFKSSCYDCHSNHTYYPWYSKIQPGSWFMEKHIKEGKKELNFNEFGSYSKRRQKSKLKSIANQIRDDKMPLFSYTLLHPNAKITKIKKNKILDWINTKLEHN
jgi:hypothetical protein